MFKVSAKHALSCEGGVSVHDDWNDQAMPRFAASALLRTRTPNRHWVHGFQVTRIRNEMHADRTAIRRNKITGSAQMVFHVAAAQHAARIDILKSREDLCGRATDNLHRDVEPATMRHREHGLFGVLLDGSGQNGIEQRQKCCFAFERISLRAKVARLQNLFEDFATDQQFENSRAIGLPGLQIPFAPEPNCGAQDPGCA